MTAEYGVKESQPEELDLRKGTLLFSHKSKLYICGICVEMGLFCLYTFDTMFTNGSI